MIKVNEPDRNPKVSIVLAAYNSGCHLRESLDALLYEQTYSDIEVLCLDEGSTDASASIIEGYMQRDPRVRLISLDRLVGGEALNIGLIQARGTYVAFHEGDSHFDRAYIDHCIQKAEETDADVVVHSAATFDTCTGKIDSDTSYLKLGILGKRYNEEIFCTDNLGDEILRFATSEPWLKFYRRDFLLEQNLFFQEIPNSFGYCFGYLTLCCAKRIAVLNEQLVLARTPRVDKESRIDCLIESIENLQYELVNRGLYDKVSRGYASAVLNTLWFNMNRMTYKRRCLFLDRLAMAGEGLQSIFSHDRDWYSGPITYRNAYSISSAVRERAYWRALSERGEGVVVKQATSTSPVVSFVVPMFNETDYLDETLHSVLEQTLSDIEVVCIDDGSSDDTLQRLEAWAEKDNRVTVLHQENQGLSAARNFGITHARGTYLLFLDGDDKMRLDAAEILTAQAERDELDMLCFTAESFFEDGFEGGESFKNYYDRQGLYPGVYNGIELLVEMRKVGDYRPSACLELIRSSFLREVGISFFKGMLHEDNPFTLSIMIRAKRAAYLNEKLYLRRIRPGSIMTRRTSFAHSFGYYLSYQFINTEVEKIRESLADDQYESLNQLAIATLKNSRRKYLEMPLEQRGSEYGTGLYYDGFNELVAKVCRLKEVEENNTQTIEKLKREKKQFESDKKQLQKEKEQLQKEKGQLQKDKEQLQKEKGQLQKDKGQLKKEKEKLKKDKERLEKQVNSKAHKVGVAIVEPYRKVTSVFRRTASKQR